MISQHDIKKIATLSRLALSEEELAQASENVSAIFDHFAAIQNVDTKEVAAADDMSALKNVTRADVAEPETLSAHARLLELAPRTSGRHLKVSAVFEEE